MGLNGSVQATALEPSPRGMLVLLVLALILLVQTSADGCDDAKIAYSIVQCDVVCDKLCCTGDCAVDTEYYCGGTFASLIPSASCGAGGCLPASTTACDGYWRNVSYQTCDKCCPDVRRWNGHNYSVCTCQPQASQLQEMKSFVFVLRL
jgi:hypothetical protein